MAKPATEPTIVTVESGLRKIAQDCEVGEFLGSEDVLRQRLGCSRNTLRQAARLLERDGVIRVKRGINGGYFGSRLTTLDVEDVVSGYLETLDMGMDDVTVVTSVLWVEVLRKASSTKSPEAKELARKYKNKLKTLKATATFADIRKFELETRGLIFKIAKCPYIELIFNISTRYSRSNYKDNPDLDATLDHLEFVQAWRDAKFMELTAIGESDPELGIMAARHIRAIWHNRLWGLLGLQPAHA